jgi:uncharacterized protein (TIGR02147 family)
MQVEAVQDYRFVLRTEFLRRHKANPRYSLRRFAQQMRVSPATMSGIFRGKRRLSVKTAAGMAEQLNLDPMQSNRFLSAVAAELVPDLASTNPRKKTAGASANQAEMIRIAQDVHQAIADWYHAAIMEMTFIPHVKLSPRNIAKKLGCSYFEAADALERLKRLGLLHEKNGKWEKSVSMLTSGTDFPSSAMRRHHLQMLQKAKQSLLTDPLEQRDFTAMTMAIDPLKLPTAKKMITEFRRRLCTFLESGDRKRVYELTVELFPLMKEDAK